ncbi:MAG: nucleotidyltransferase family protein [Candidatus Lambdaproteobacteria bacterium]|nr:nucleotidyltransferase family protein [Candidatus Lambdaproteobacteria bacterium]
MMTAIVLAAGQSTRMGGQNKLLLPFRGTTLIERMVDAVIASGVESTVAVLGHDADRVRPLLENRPVTVAENPAYEEGMAGSIRAGLRAAPAGCDGYMICLTDMPLLEAQDLARLLAAFSGRPAGKDILLASHQGRRGNPVLFAARYREEVAQARGPIGGCKGIVQRYPEQVLAVELGNDHAVWDIDTPEDYQRLLALHGQQRAAGGESLP